jgi:hypothetical protein
MQATVNESNQSQQGFLESAARRLRCASSGAIPFLITVKGFIAPLALLISYRHLEMGQVILETFSIPRVDIFLSRPPVSYL